MALIGNAGNPTNPSTNSSTSTPHTTPRMVRKEPRTVTLPVSQVNVWTRCPGSAIFTGSKGSVDSKACSRGTALHAIYKVICDDYLRACHGQTIDPRQTRTAIQTVIDAAARQGIHITDTDISKLYALKDAMSKAIGPVTFCAAGAETTVLLTDYAHGITADGVADFWMLVSSGILHVFDIKTGTRPEHPDDELACYALGLTRQLAGYRIDQVILHVLQDGPYGPADRTMVVTHAYLKDLAARIGSSAQIILDHMRSDREDSPFIPGPYCTKCSWRRSCPAYRRALERTTDLAQELHISEYSVMAGLAYQTVLDVQARARRGKPVPGWELDLEGPVGIKPTNA